MNCELHDDNDHVLDVFVVIIVASVDEDDPDIPFTELNLSFLTVFGSSPVPISVNLFRKGGAKIVWIAWILFV